MTAMPTFRRRADLVTLIAAPTVWALHFLAVYIVAAVWCARAGDAFAPLTSIRLVIGAVTLVALALIAFFGAQAYRNWGFGRQAPPHDADTPEDRRRFLGYATLLLAGLSFVAVIYAALPAVFVADCR